MPVLSHPDFSLTRTNAAAVILVLCALLSSVRVIFIAPSPRHLASDDVTRRSDQRFAALKAELPPHGVVGYLDAPGPSATPDYYLAQYAVAPLVLDRSTNHALVVGNFHEPALTLPSNFVLIKDFGNGVVLFSNKDAK